MTINDGVADSIGRPRSSLRRGVSRTMVVVAARHGRRELAQENAGGPGDRQDVLPAVLLRGSGEGGYEEVTSGEQSLHARRFPSMASRRSLLILV
jgi:hypothetical protein